MEQKDFATKISEFEEKLANFDKRKLLLLIPVVLLIALIPLFFNEKATQERTIKRQANELLNAAQNDCDNQERFTKIVFGKMVEEEFTYSNTLPEYGYVATDENCQVAIAIFDEGQCAKKYFWDNNVGVTETPRQECLLTKNIFAEQLIHEKVADGYIPIDNYEDLTAIGSDEQRIFAKNKSYQITTTGTLNDNYILTSNIDLTDQIFEVIGNAENPFKGIFDGNYNRLENILINSEKEAGLFYNIEDASITNLRLDIEYNGNEIIGGISVFAKNSSLSNIIVEGNINGSDYLGGLIGKGENITIEESHSKVTITGNNNLGGLVGEGLEINIKNSYVNNKMNADGPIGGLVGKLQSGKIINSYAINRANEIFPNFIFLGDAEIIRDVDTIFDESNITKFETVTGEIIIENSFFGVENHSFFSGNIVKLLSLLKEESTFNDWDETIWKITAGKYPTLKKELN